VRPRLVVHDHVIAAALDPEEERVLKAADAGRRMRIALIRMVPSLEDRKMAGEMETWGLWRSTG